MPRRPKKYHFIYKTTNTINGKFYIGMHSTDDLDDGYIGSGKKLWNSIKKYGRDNFITEKLEFFNNREVLIEREKQLVDDDLLKDPKCMNLKLGGHGGFYSIDACIKGALARANKYWKDPEFIKNHKIKHSLRLKKLHKDGIIKPVDWTGKKHSEKTKLKIKEQKKNHGLGSLNSQFGTCWIYKKNENKKIKREELFSWLNKGWSKGRKIN